MSRVGKLPIPVPQGVTVTIAENAATVKGPKGEMVVPFQRVSLELQDNELVVNRASDGRQDRAYHGLYRALLANAVNGVSAGFKKDLEIVGVGWRCEMQGKNLVLHVGYSHPVEIEPPAGIAFATPDKNKITVEGFDRQKVGQVTADIRKWRPPEPYKGKGIRYAGEIVRQKAGKSKS